MADVPQIKWADYAQIINNAIQLVAPFVAAGIPGSAAAIMMVAKIVDGVEKGLPSAIALWNDIQNGKQPTQLEMDQYWTEYQQAYGELDAAITEALKTAKD